MQISDVLGIGEETARTGKELAALFHCDIRTITETIERERMAGKPICASTKGKNKGYYMAATLEDAEYYCSRLLHREKEIGRTRNAIRRGARKTFAHTEN